MTSEEYRQLIRDLKHCRRTGLSWRFVVVDDGTRRALPMIGGRPVIIDNNRTLIYHPEEAPVASR